MADGNCWRVVRGRSMVLVGCACIIVPVFFAADSSGWVQLLTVLGAGLILLGIPMRTWLRLPAWFRREDSWL